MRCVQRILLVLCALILICSLYSARLYRDALKLCDRNVPTLTVINFY